MKRRIFFYVQHLLGIGHLKRAATLARALAQRFEVTLVSGGHAVPDLELGQASLHQLPPTRATDLYFKLLVDEHDQPIDDDWRRHRRDALLAAYREIAPQALLFELFPFGRRQMRFELLPLLEQAAAARPRPLIACSVRDILVGQHKPERNDEMLSLIERYFERILVHGDPELIALDETFPHTARIKGRLAYTGYVVDESGRRGGPGAAGWDEVVVSAGGGAVGFDLLEAAIAARRLSRAADATWRVLVGYKVADQEFAALAAEARRAGTGLIVERARGDFPTLLMNCRLSISQGGYNTVMETLRAGARAVVVPYAGGIETEQTLRARLLAERGRLEVVAEDELDADKLAAAVDRALAGPPARAQVDTGGAGKTAALLEQWLA